MGKSGAATKLNKALYIVLVLVMLGAIAALAYVIAAPKLGERFTEFYILGLSGKAMDYPQELMVGKEGRVIVGIINREHEPVTYRVEVVIDGVKNNEVGPVILEHEGKWEGEVSFMPEVAGDNQKVEFLLYKNNGEGEPCLKPLYLWINIKE